MNRIASMIVVGVVVVTALAARPPADAGDAFRLGNDAFVDHRYTAAVELYEKAEAATTDPGLVAFNKAASFYKLAHSEKSDLARQRLYQQAELHYRCCLSDAVGLRRARALLGRGNSLIQSGRNSRLSEEAVFCYRECLRLAEGEDDELAADARHNLEVAKALWLKQRVAERESRTREEDPNHTDPAGSEKSPSRDPGNDPTRNSGDPNAVGQPRPGVPVRQPRDGSKPIETNRRSPNRGDRAPGNLEQPREQADVDLQDAVERIILKRRESRGNYVPPNGSVKDW